MTRKYLAAIVALSLILVSCSPAPTPPPQQTYVEQSQPVPAPQTVVVAPPSQVQTVVVHDHDNSGLVTGMLIGSALSTGRTTVVHHTVIVPARPVYVAPRRVYVVTRLRK